MKLRTMLTAVLVCVLAACGGEARARARTHPLAPKPHAAMVAVDPGPEGGCVVRFNDGTAVPYRSSSDCNQLRALVEGQ